VSAQATLTEGAAFSKKSSIAFPTLFRVLNAERLSEPSARHVLYEVDGVQFGRAEQNGWERRAEGDLRLLRIGLADPWVSGRHAVISRVMRAWVVEDLKSKNGVRLNGQLVQRAELADGDVIELGRTFFVFRSQQPLLSPESLDAESGPGNRLLPGLSTLQPELAVQISHLKRVAPTNVTVALRGKTGTGKEVLARAVHALSGRSGPFVAVNCGALPENLVESELFGHRKGSFSGATEDRLGLVRTAHGGTLFLDEVGDLPPGAQPALLRVLQERQVTPVGGTTPMPVDVRVISATHRDLAMMVAREQFRDDLRARISGFEFELPDLAERKEDLGILARELTERIAGPRAASLRFHHEAARALFLYDWPLNVRELEKVLETATVLAGHGQILREHLPEAVRNTQPGSRAASLNLAAGDAERKAQLEALLRQHGGNVSSVARAMGKARMQIQRWLARYNIDPRDFRG
jgi:transcriptional regulator of acetoin/glycerol metabolism